MLLLPPYRFKLNPLVRVPFHGACAWVLDKLLQLWGKDSNLVEDIVQRYCEWGLMVSER